MKSPSAVLLAHFAEYLLQFRGSLISELVARGYKTTVIVPGLTPKLVAALAERGAESRNISLERTSLNPFADATYRKQLYVTLMGICPDVAIAYGVKPIVYGIPIAARANSIFCSSVNCFSRKRFIDSTVKGNCSTISRICDCNSSNV